jgi:predicted esterase
MCVASVASGAEWSDLTGKPVRTQVLCFSTDPKPPASWYFIPDRQKEGGVLLQYTDAAVLGSFIKALQVADGAGLTELKGRVHARLEGGEWQSWPLAVNTGGALHLKANGKAYVLPATFGGIVKTQAAALLEAVPTALVGEIKSAAVPKGKMIINGSDTPRLAKPLVPMELIDGIALTEFKGLGENKNGLTHRPAFDIKQEKFSVWVPANYSDTEAFGLYVWMTPGEGAPSFPPEWQAVFEEKRLIWIGAHETGNKEDAFRRNRLAQEARLAGLRNFNIDPKRIYGSGFSGGSRMISWMLAKAPPQDWTGTVHFAGIDPLAESIPMIARTDIVHFGNKPEAGALEFVRKNVRMFLVQGADDKVNTSTPHVLAWGEKEHLMMKGRIIPGLGHAVPKDPAIIREAIEFLDLPRKGGREDTTTSTLPELVTRAIESLSKLAATNPAGARQQAALVWERYPEARTNQGFLTIIESLEKWP